MRQMEGSGLPVVQLAGAAGAAVALAQVTERQGIRREVAALGGAAVALAVSQASGGTTRAFFQGAALGSLGVAIVEFVRRFREEASTRVTNAAQSPSTREQLQTALKRFTESRANVDPRATVSVQSDSVPARTETESKAPEVVEKLNAVVERLSDDERAELRLFIDTAPEETLRIAQSFLLDTPRDEAVRFLREHLLTSQPS
jgi:hypothetical protein